MKGEYRRNGRVIVRRGLALSLGLWLALVVGVLPQPALAAFNPTDANTISWFYTAAFGRTPVPNSALPGNGDLRGLTFWTDAYLAGAGDLAQYNRDVYAIADFFVTSPEFQTRYPTLLTNEAFVTALYENMLGREPDAGGLAFWTAKLDADESRGKVLADFANTPENRDSNPARKAALESFIAFIDADADGTITPDEAAEWLGLAENENLDAATVDTTFVLAVTKEGNGSGIIASNPAIPTRIDCGSTCRANFHSDESVSLTATANADSTFAGWTPDDRCADSFAMPANNLTCTAAFTLKTYTVTAEVTGDGGSIDPTSQTVNHGETTTFTVNPNTNSGYITADVTGCDGTLAGSIYTTGPITAACPVTATFTVPTFTLTTESSGTGSGTVAGGGDYAAGAEVTLTAMAGANSTFVGWTPDPCEASFEMPANNLTCTATFYTVLQSPTFDPGEGTYDKLRPIRITTTTPEATIRFATVDNETNPLTCTTGTFLENRGQVMVDRPLTLHAIACLNGQASVPATATYEIKITNRVTFNDTGIDQCAENDRYEIPCPITRFPGQDAEYGRDAWARGDFAGNPPRNPPHSTGLAKIGGGAVGFDFTRMCGDGRDEGQDGCLENLDFNPNNPSLRTGDGPDDWACTRDNVTSLIWEIKTDAADIPSRELRDKNWTYTWYNPNSATNGSNPGVRTGGICRLSGTQQPSCDTQGYLAAINDMIINGKKLCGGADWRLPTSNELNQLMHYGRIQPSMDEAYFPTVVPGIKWTSETLAADSSLAWIVASSNGAVEPTFKGNPFGRILAVSGPKQATGNSNHCQNGFSSTVSGEFEDHGNGTVTHETTQLMWARCALGRTWNGGSCTGPAKHYNWENALQELKRLNNSREYANYSDWRIPNIKELNSIVEHCRTNPAINTTVFPDMSPTMTDFWSSSPLTTVQSSAWYVDFRFGRVDWTGKSNAYQVLLVRDAYNRDAYN